MTGQTAKRVLIVEDEVLLAMHLEDLLTELWHEVVSLATRINEALDLARESDIDLALQLRFSKTSESMGFHDSEVMDDGSIDRGDA